MVPGNQKATYVERVMEEAKANVRTRCCFILQYSVITVNSCLLRAIAPTAETT